MSVEKFKENLASIVFRNGAKVILHNSFLLQKLSRIGFMQGRQDAMWVETATYDENNKASKTVCKMQFHDDKDAQEFKKIVDSLIN